jgi:hypothetical protein
MYVVIGDSDGCVEQPNCSDDSLVFVVAKKNRVTYKVQELSH